MLRERPVTAKADLGAKAFDTFKRIAAQDQPNGAETSPMDGIWQIFPSRARTATASNSRFRPWGCLVRPIYPPSCC